MRLADYDLCDLSLFENGFPHDVFALHRREAPVYWHPATRYTPDGVGFWSVATHGESLEVIHDAKTFSSVGGGDRPRGGTILPDTVIFPTRIRRASPTASSTRSSSSSSRRARTRRATRSREVFSS